MNVRAARLDEADAVLRMFEWLFAEPGYKPQTWDTAHAREAVARAISGSFCTILVAVAQDGSLAGVISAYLDLDSIRYGQRCWVEDLAVDPARRSQGIGKALLDAAKSWARERGATHLELDTGLRRADAQRFYDREEPDTKGYTYSWVL